MDNSNENGRGTCEVCKRNFKLVGKKNPSLANHGFKVEQYGQSRPCMGSGFTPEKSLSGAIRRLKHQIEWDLINKGFEWRAENGKKTLEWLLTR